eukprot:GHVU01145932.1.p3 GENE.GHVU01145932.1~~GHVU01145932.1.p3  ORF type:complete len:103 (-),score=4.15 GHVU01145932.1:298-606(-)
MVTGMPLPIDEYGLTLRHRLAVCCLHGAACYRRRQTSPCGGMRTHRRRCIRGGGRAARLAIYSGFVDHMESLLKEAAEKLRADFLSGKRRFVEAASTRFARL